MTIKISEIANLPSKWGNFKIQSFKENDKEHLCIFKDEPKDILNLRIHSECLTGDALGSLKCDCGEQLEFSLKYIEQNGGMIIYLRQEGRGIGLFNKVNAYALQDKGLNTIEANHELGFKADERTYEIVNFILKHYKISKINLLTNNPEKLESLKDKILIRVPVLINPNRFNKNYLDIKQSQMGHLL
ncbi:GTP cyclohydrolase II [Campylobacter sp. LH-2024]|uniref:GTP cyclohydrolase II n=1 Tax=Campylobacter molothri TaxID=1032242 RepID=A0ACC5W061_9BACT|nr:GTP cyclohydrolase II [Campylobacter sp. 2018MI35]MBZ7927941.1 GTP cyclohydrolase II [Campylobacter sp. RM10542]MBZ7931330.1 GTP cyclohydrolase II [Campylobacter sp. RM12910]MBZ7942990.1 GTP cyclohydrolase II [Campylobacter sp. RM13744]MBZ7946926.1 GTP cyclohydrolase II [Campylobacter sp. RM10536]MBZ7947361.1 GTP cyclohydrolase II [Campylobacter sp. RM9929]MBZ7950295.1 GTP cyclohydrolase II [Campylobacter sp. W0046]MBZ7951757.1 GTP cyclohydrolase II [Campylobacter sp. RM9939]MBZ7954763.1